VIGLVEAVRAQVAGQALPHLARTGRRVDRVDAEQRDARRMNGKTVVSSFVPPVRPLAATAPP
jgi:hypothetical protein